MAKNFSLASMAARDTHGPRAANPPDSTPRTSMRSNTSDS